MPVNHAQRIARELELKIGQVERTIGLLDDDATVPFIARYRKEMTDSLDEVRITAIRDRIQQLRELDTRREAILKSLEERELLTDELREKIEAAESMAILEDVYLPYRPKRRTRATMARERGLEPLAELLFAQDDGPIDPEAERFIDAEKGVDSVEDALAGARDIVAEWINEDSDARAGMRKLFAKTGVIGSRVATGKETEGAKYSDYFDWEESVAQIPSHRILALMRGESESILKVTIRPPEDEALSLLEGMFVIAANAASAQVQIAVQDAYKRLLAPAMETELRTELKTRADDEAIRVFADNLRQLLMAPPLGRKRVLAIDPGFRTGCKMVCLDRHGSLEHNATIFPHGSETQRREAEQDVKAACERFRINVVAIGNGTAGRETETFVRALGLPEHIQIVMVSEAGASVYSASEVAREEFPDYDVTVRGAVSIGRRLMDPLSELVKIDPKAIGVGQYQHDVDQSALKDRLDDTVVSCVNAVGVEVNTASKELLGYVSGVGPKLAERIVAYRAEKGPFRARGALMKVPRLGPKVFQQAAGFIRIADAENPLDRSAVHPESYKVVEAMARDAGCSVGVLMQQAEAREGLDLTRYVSDTVGMPTLTDILAELAKPGRDPRSEFEAFSFDDSVQSMNDLKPGMRLPGIVTNVTAFGAFVDIGVHQDGLVHISQLADRYIKDPFEVVKVQQQVWVTVLDVDLERKRIALSMRSVSTDRPPA